MKYSLLLIITACLPLVLQADNDSLRPRLAEGVIDTLNHETAGLPKAAGVTTVTIFKPTDQSRHYSNAVAMTAFKDALYCMWQSSQTDEDAPDTRLVYSRSDDEGLTWSEPAVLDDATADTYSTSGGWLVCGDTLTAFINRWPKSLAPVGGYTYYICSTDGRHWSQPQPVRMADGSAMNGMIEQDPYPMPDGRIIGAAHFQPGLHVCPVYTDDPTGAGGWQRGTFEAEDCGKQSRELEPSQYVRPDGSIVMLFRDQKSSFCKLASVSTDRGATWSKPALTDIPDARTKQCAGNLPDGTAFMIGCPANGKRRWPLVLMLSKDGEVFDKALLLRSGSPTDLPPRRYEGRYKTLGYSYPKAMTHRGKLYVGYSTNKENVECTIITLDSAEKQE